LAEGQHALPEGQEEKFLKYAAFLSRNKWRIVAGVSLVVAVLLVIALVQSLRKRKEARAFQAHREAKTAKDHQRVGENFAGTSYGSFSLIEAGNLLFRKERYAEARKLYMKFLRSYPESRFRPWVYNLVGATFEAEQKYDQAIHHYGKAQDFSSVELQAKLNRGRCWELKGDLQSEKNPKLALDHYDKARTFYQQLTGTGSSPRVSPQMPSPWGAQAQSRMRSLGEKETKARESEKKVDRSGR